MRKVGDQKDLGLLFGAKGDQSGDLGAREEPAGLDAAGARLGRSDLVLVIAGAEAILGQHEEVGVAASEDDIRHFVFVLESHGLDRAVETHDRVGA